MPKPQNKYPFPFVECDFHKGPQRSYVICKHIIDEGKPPAIVTMATDEDMGYILCDLGYDGHDPRELIEKGCRLICEGCAIAHGHLITE